MKLLFASDSFKGTLSSEKTIELLDKAAREVFGEVRTRGVSVADGGEGTTDAVIQARGGKRCMVKVHGPLMEETEAFYGRISEEEGVMEMAAASGLPLVPPELRDPLKTTTYGTGELLLHMIEDGIRKIGIAIGGSATNDGGMGFAEALGVRFLDAEGKVLSGCGENLEKVETIDLSGMDPRVKEAKITVMCDVVNPLTGENGATYTFGKQKGGTPESLKRLEAGMENYRQRLLQTFGVDVNEYPGTGAAGGLGAALLLFTKATMRSGIETVLDLIRFDDYLKGTDLVVTGEGRTDWQSAFGKVMQGVGDRCAKHGVIAVGLCGGLGEGYQNIYAHGISSIMTTTDGPMPLEEAMERASELYYEGAIRLFRLIRAGQAIK